MKKTVIGFILILLVILTSCVSTKSASEITPLNLYSISRFADKNLVSFVGEAQDESLRQAQLLSYMDLYEKVYRYLGIEPEPESYRELSTLGTISQYNLKIQDSTSYVSKNGYTNVLIASADKNLLAKDRSKSMVKEEEVAKQVIEIVLQGDEYIKNNMDVEGIRCYLKSMQLSYGLQYIENEFSFSSILNEVLDFISSLKIEVDKVNSDDASCRIKVTRRGSITPSKVVDSQIRATFTSEDARGQKFTDSFMYTTNDRGIIDFVPRVYNIEKDGTISFGFDFDKEIEEISKLSPTVAELITNALNEKVKSFSYKLKYENGAFGICTQCVTVQGTTAVQDWIDDFLVDKYHESDIEAFTFEYVEDETEQELLDRFRREHPYTENLIFFRVGATESLETRMGICSVAVEGTVVVYNLKNNEIIYDSGVTYANGFGSTIFDAQEVAFKNYALIMFNLLKAYYV